MDWSIIALVALVGALFLWRQSKNAEKAKAATERLESDSRLYQHIKTGMREYQWREQKQEFWKAKDGELLFETAHLSVFCGFAQLVRSACVCEGRSFMTGAQSRALKVGDRVSWSTDTNDLGTVTQRNWAGVTIKWDNRNEQSILHNDMGEVFSVPAK